MACGPHKARSQALIWPLHAAPQAIFNALRYKAEKGNYTDFARNSINLNYVTDERLAKIRAVAENGTDNDKHKLNAAEKAHRARYLYRMGKGLSCEK